MNDGLFLVLLASIGFVLYLATRVVVALIERRRDSILSGVSDKLIAIESRLAGLDQDIQQLDQRVDHVDKSQQFLGRLRQNDRES